MDVLYAHWPDLSQGKELVWLAYVALSAFCLCFCARRRSYLGLTANSAILQLSTNLELTVVLSRWFQAIVVLIKKEIPATLVSTRPKISLWKNTSISSAKLLSRKSDVLVLFATTSLMMQPKLSLFLSCSHVLTIAIPSWLVSLSPWSANFRESKTMHVL